MGLWKLTSKVILGAAAFSCVMLVLPRAARAQGKIELFGGFSYVRGNVIYQQQGSGSGISCGLLCPRRARQSTLGNTRICLDGRPPAHIRLSRF